MIYPGEWICTIKELTGWFRTHFQHQTLDILDELQKRNLISYLPFGREKEIKYKIRDWKNYNTVLDYNCPCQKDTGFFFMPVTTALELVGAGRCSEMDILLDLWLSTVYNDRQVQGSEAGPVVYLRNYLSTMFQISDVLIDKEEVAMVLNIRISLPEKDGGAEDKTDLEPEVCVSEELSSVSKTQMEAVIRKVAEILDLQGGSCFRCVKVAYKLYPLSDDWEGKYLFRPREAPDRRIGMDVCCGDEREGMRSDKEAEGDGHCRESIISRHMEIAEEIQGCGLEPVTVRAAGAGQV